MRRDGRAAKRRRADDQSAPYRQAAYMAPIRLNRRQIYVVAVVDALLLLGDELQQAEITMSLVSDVLVARYCWSDPPHAAITTPVVSRRGISATLLTSYGGI